MSVDCSTASLGKSYHGHPGGTSPGNGTANWSPHGSISSWSKVRYLCLWFLLGTSDGICLKSLRNFIAIVLHSAWKIRQYQDSWKVNSCSVFFFLGYFNRGNVFKERIICKNKSRYHWRKAKNECYNQLNYNPVILSYAKPPSETKKIRVVNRH